MVKAAAVNGDIVSGALALIEREGTDEAVTLRAVAREIGIRSSIYAHFPDRSAIMLVPLGPPGCFDEFTRDIRAGCCRPRGPCGTPRRGL